MPHKASAVTGRPPSAGKARFPRGSALHKGDSQTVSYEDLIIAQYLDELKKTPPYTKETVSALSTSPYQQKLAHTDIIPTPQQVKAAMRAARPLSGKKSSRPQSATSASMGRPAKQERHKIDAHFIPDTNSYDHTSPRQNGVVHRQRPMSAPNRRTRPISASSKVSFGGRRRFKPLYAKQPHTIVVTAFKNGSRETFVKVAAPTIKLLLEMCTDKLGLNAAARRAFLEDGSEIFTENDIPRDAEIYISQGEPFRNPYIPVKYQSDLQKTISWTINGLVLPTDNKRGVTRSFLSKRFTKSCIEMGKRRVIIFRNGVGNDGGGEVVADLDKPQEFLNACTSRLNLGTPARVLYDWEGNELYDLNDTPVLDDCLQSGNTPVLGPLWVSKGEGFSPKGPKEFLSTLVAQVKARIKELKHYKQQLGYGKTESEKYKVEIVAILSMSEAEITEAQTVVQKDIEDWTNAFNRLKVQLDKIEEKAMEEESQGFNYTMQHIKQVETNDRLVGRQGIKLKVYANGTYENEEIVYFNVAETSKDVAGDKIRIMHRLLDHCTSLVRPVNAPALSAVAKKLYDKTGQEVTDPFKLRDDQELWLSYGEAFKQSFVLCLQTVFDKAKGYNLFGEKNIGIREQLIADDIGEPGRDRPSAWDASIGFPVSYDFKCVDAETDAMTKDHVMTLMKTSEVSVNSTYLQCKDDENLILFADLIIDTKKKRGSNDIWPADSQLWVISKKGYIYSKSMPQILLTVSDMKVDTKLSTQFSSEVQGYGVHLAKKMVGNPHQQWGFSADGYIYSLAYPELVLTHLGNIFGDEESDVVNGIEGIPSGHVFFIAVCNKLQGKDGRMQRWAIKQERLDNLGQWKLSDVPNPEWNKKALSWPVTQEGSWNEEFDWPMEGFLLPGAPPIKKKEDPKKGNIPLRLNVLKNGTRDLTSVTAVVGPDLTNMMKDYNKTSLNGKRRHTHHRSPVDKRSRSAQKSTPDDDMKDSIDDEPNLHCHHLTLYKLEFTLFLERCTSLLNLPFAARRLFDENGREHFTLNNLERDQLVFVSCGDLWTDPRFTKSEQQRRLLLANLAQDVAQVRQYCALRSPENYVLEVEGTVVAGARLVINQSCLSMEEQQMLKGDINAQSVSTMPSHESREQNRQALEDYLQHKSSSAHDRAHAKSDQRLDNLKWPWERILNDDIYNEENGDQTSPRHNLEGSHRFKPKVSPRHPGFHLQKFRFSDGFIFPTSNSSLVLGVIEQEGRVTEVVLVKKKTDDINQRWILKDDGMIQSRFSSQFVVSVSMPTPSHSSDDNIQLSYAGSGVSVQHRKSSLYGKANQRWHYNQDTGFIHAFFASPEDKEITSAIKANVCTYAVRRDEELDQPGYIVNVPMQGSAKQEEIIVCASCARTMRGKHKLQKLSDNIEFTCAMGRAKDKGLKQMGSFKCLNGKVDLSTYEAENTLQEWESQLANLRDESSVRTIAQTISAAESVRPVKVYAYKNGDGRLKPGQLVVGSSVTGILDQCTHTLGLTSAARRLYTHTGDIILDIDDLITWAVNNYCQLLDEHQRKEQARNKVQKSQNDTDMGVSPSKQNGLSQDTGSSGPREVHELMDHMTINESGSNQSTVSGQQAPPGGSSDKIVPPPVEVILRYPIEVWVSCGEQFITPEDAEEKHISQVQNHEEKSAIIYELEKQKHVLRQMQGRRLDELNPGNYRGNRDPTNPVLIEGNWQEPSEQEQMKHHKVHQLQSQLSSLKSSQKTEVGPPRTMSIDTSRRLYLQPNMKRVLMFPNGESIDKCVYVWGSSVEQLLENARDKLSLMRPGKRLFDVTGMEIDNFDEVQRDMILCASSGKPFLKPKDSVTNVEVKANWVRARNEYGPKATDIMVAPSHNPNVDVDPFGPPELAMRPDGNDILTGRSERSGTNA